MLANPENNETLVNIIKKSIETVTAQDCNNYYINMCSKLLRAEPL